MEHIIMHQTTFNYLRYREDFELSNNIQAKFSDFNMKGIDIVINNSCKETINEPSGWIFPFNKFITYEKGDEEWCRPLGIGRQGRGFILGDIFLLNSLTKAELDVKWFNRKSFVSQSNVGVFKYVN